MSIFLVPSLQSGIRNSSKPGWCLLDRKRLECLPNLPVVVMHPPGVPTPPFFVGRNSKRIPIHMFERAFQQIRHHAGLQREGGSRRQPRLHDLRHTSAVHRLIAWYREDKDVQKLLPRLSVYMGHAQLAATQAYLTMTPDLLQEASLRFERYAIQEGSND